jgi:hypothetical protein
MAEDQGSVFRTEVNCPVSLSARQDLSVMHRALNQRMQKHYYTNPSLSAQLEVAKLNCLENFFIVSTT